MNALVFGAFWFWVIIFVSGVILTVIVEQNEPNQWGLIVLVILGFILYHCGNHKWFNSLFTDISSDPGKYVLYCLGYFVTGVIWSFIKWYYYLIDLKPKILTSSYYSSRANVNENKERIINWMIYWPLSAFWTLINQPIRKAFNGIFKGIEKRYQKMSDRIINVNKTVD